MKYVGQFGRLSGWGVMFWEAVAKSEVSERNEITKTVSINDFRARHRTRWMNEWANVFCLRREKASSPYGVVLDYWSVASKLVGGCLLADGVSDSSPKSNSSNLNAQPKTLQEKCIQMVIGWRLKWTANRLIVWTMTWQEATRKSHCSEHVLFYSLHVWVAGKQ